MQRIHLIVHGFVQGVFFRTNAVKKAQDSDLRGYAKNLSDGTVEVVAEGPQDKLEELIEFCKNSPGASEVSKVDVKFEKPKNEFSSFGVKY